MNNKNIIDLSPKIFRVVSIMSILSIIIHIITDLIYIGRIDHMAIVPLIILFIFSENSRVKSSAKKNK